VPLRGKKSHAKQDLGGSFQNFRRESSSFVYGSLPCLCSQTFAGIQTQIVSTLQLMNRNKKTINVKLVVNPCAYSCSKRLSCFTLRERRRDALSERIVTFKNGQRKTEKNRKKWCIYLEVIGNTRSSPSVISTKQLLSFGK